MSATEKAKEEYIVDYVASISAIEEAMEPFKEQKRDLRKEYVENGWLTKDEIKTAVRAFRLMKQDVDFDELRSTYRTLRGTVGPEADE